MSADVHFSDAPDGTIPKRFLCRKKPKSGNEWTRFPWLVECSRCVAAMKQERERVAAEQNQSQQKG